MNDEFKFFVKIQKKYISFFFGGGAAVWGIGLGSGVRVDVNGEVEK